MNREDFKPEQLEVLDTVNKNLIVSASAGSGKTTVMIQKIIEDIIDRQIDLKRILVLTYTSASADEMKQKLSGALYEKAVNNIRCIRQIDDLATADISTIHSFFQKMIKKYFTAIDVSPDFSILDDVNAKKYEELALSEAIDIYGDLNPDNMAILMDIFGKARNDKTLKKTILKISNFLKSVEDPAYFKEYIATKLYDDDVEGNIAFKIVNKELIDIALSYARKFKKLQIKYDSLGLDYFVTICNSYLSMLESVQASQSEFFTNCENLKKKPTIKMKNLKDFPNESKELSDLMTHCKKFLCDKVAKWNFTTLTVDKSMNVMPFIINCLLDLTDVYEMTFAKIKLKSNLMDYNDLEKYMLKLLEHDDIRDEIIDTYSCIYVDEYQDANRVQEKILKLICRRNNRFMVGDVKQSIYRFRQAEPDIFLENQELFARDKNSDVKLLNCNFRSEKTILDFVNIVFNEIMTLNTAKIDYKNTSKLDGQAIYKKVEEIPPVEISIIKKAEKEKKLPPSEIYRVPAHSTAQKNYTTAELEAFLVANKILNLIGKKIYLPSIGAEKLIDYSDITILLRSRGEYLTEFCAVMSKFQIPIYANTKKPLYEDSDIQILLSLLLLCVNENNDIELVTVLHSVFGGFTFNELAKIRHSHEDKKATFFECYKAYNKQDEIFEKIKKFEQMLANLKFRIRFTGIFYALNKVINVYNFNSYLLSKMDGLEKVEKVKKFLNDFLTNNFNNNVIEFLEFVKRNKEEIMSPNFANGENCVNVTTIHSSKGLEFPIVFVVNAGQDFNKTPEDKGIQLNAKLGVGLKFFDIETREKSHSLVLEAITKQNNDEDFAEKLRLLYVALTRPKNHLFIIGTTSKEFEKIHSDFDVLQQNSYLNLIVNSLPEQEIDKINAGEKVENENYNVEIISAEADDNLLELIEKRIIPPLYDQEKQDKIREYFEYEYPYRVDVTTKNSVTSILKAESPYISQNTSPKNIVVNEHNPIKFNELGTAYHEILEAMDFEIATLGSIQDYIEKHFNHLKEQIDSQKILDNIQLLKRFDLSNILKEQKFVMNIPHSEVVEGGCEDEILVQGIVDLLILGEKNILIDYKLSTQNSNNKLIEKYALQLKLYKKASESAMGIKIDEVYILHINKKELVKVEV